MRSRTMPSRPGQQTRCARSHRCIQLGVALWLRVSAQRLHKLEGCARRFGDQDPGQVLTLHIGGKPWGRPNQPWHASHSPTSRGKDSDAQSIPCNPTSLSSVKAVASTSPVGSSSCSAGSRDGDGSGASFAIPSKLAASLSHGGSTSSWPCPRRDVGDSLGSACRPRLAMPSSSWSSPMVRFARTSSSASTSHAGMGSSSIVDMLAFEELVCSYNPAPVAEELLLTLVTGRRAAARQAHTTREGTTS
jgi:hypothetical protein